MNKRKLHHYWRKFRLLKPWYFFALALLFAVLAVFSLRNNYKHMVVLRNAVYQADEKNGDVAGALNKLRSYVYGHMNTNLAAGTDAVYPPIQLKYTYDRLIMAQSAQTSQTNNQIYSDAQKYCEQLYPTGFSGGVRVPCITQYVDSHTTKTQPIPDGLYKFSFATPGWSPDTAGWSIVVTILSLATGVLLIIVRRLATH